MAAETATGMAEPPAMATMSEGASPAEMTGMPPYPPPAGEAPPMAYETATASPAYVRTQTQLDMSTELRRDPAHISFAVMAFCPTAC